MTRTDPVTWVVGAGGLLGSTVAANLPAGTVWRAPERIAWGTPLAVQQLDRAARAFLADAGDRPWQVAWCAGPGTTGTTADQLATEHGALETVLHRLGTATDPGVGGLFLASSGGGLYAGATTAAPHDEFTPAAPISAYGEARLRMEELVASWHARTGVPSLVGRLSNLYGPGQNLAKPQGLISHLVRAALLGLPISIYVPMDTVRDNLFVGDAARLVRDGLSRLRAASVTEPVLATKVLASQQAVTIGFLIAELGRIVKRRPRVVYRPTAVTALQARDLRMRSVIWPDLDAAPHVPLPVGMRRTVEALSQVNAEGRLR